MVRTFKSREGWLMNTIVGTTLLFTTISVSIAFYQNKTDLISFLILIVILLILIFGFFIPRPSYQIDNEFIRYRSGLWRGKIQIAKIHKIEVGKTMWSGYKIAAATKGIIIHYNKYDEIYFSPQNHEEFIVILCRLNPTIQILKM